MSVAESLTFAREIGRVAGIIDGGAYLTGSAGPGRTVTVDNAAEGPIYRATVHGNTVQNHFPPLDAKKKTGGIRIGVVLYANDDGSYQLKGDHDITDTGNYSSIARTLMPGRTYTLSTVESGDGAGTVSYVVERYDSEGGPLGRFSVTSGQLPATITIEEEASYCVVGLESAFGESYELDVYPMVNEGTEPMRWVRPGLSFVESAAIDLFGKNLARGESVWSYANGTPYVLYDEATGTFTVNARNSLAWKDSPQSLYLKKGSYAVSGSIFGNSHVVEIGTREGRIQVGNGNRVVEPTVVQIPKDGTYSVKIVSDGNTYPFSGTLQIEMGDEQTGYELPWHSKAAVPLPEGHPYLACLPDGTSDELTVFWDGTARLTAWVGVVDVTGADTEEMGPSAADGENWCTWVRIDPIFDRSKWRYVMCDGLPIWQKMATSNAVSGEIGPYTAALYVGASAHGDWIYIRTEQGATVSDTRAWLKQNNLRFAMALREPVNYWYDGESWTTGGERPDGGALGPIECRGDTVSAWAETQGVGADVSLKYLKASTDSEMLYSLVKMVARKAGA